MTSHAEPTKTLLRATSSGGATHPNEVSVVVEHHERSPTRTKLPQRTEDATLYRYAPHALHNPRRFAEHVKATEALRHRRHQHPRHPSRGQVPLADRPAGVPHPHRYRWCWRCPYVLPFAITRPHHAAWTRGATTDSSVVAPWGLPRLRAPSLPNNTHAIENNTSSSGGRVASRTSSRAGSAQQTPALTPSCPPSPPSPVRRHASPMRMERNVAPSPPQPQRPEHEAEDLVRASRETDQANQAPLSAHAAAELIRDLQRQLRQLQACVDGMSGITSAQFTAAVASTPATPAADVMDAVDAVEGRRDRATLPSNTLASAAATESDVVLPPDCDGTVGWDSTMSVPTVTTTHNNTTRLTAAPGDDEDKEGAQEEQFGVVGAEGERSAKEALRTHVHGGAKTIQPTVANVAAVGEEEAVLKTTSRAGGRGVSQAARSSSSFASDCVSPTSPSPLTTRDLTSEAIARLREYLRDLTQSDDISSIAASTPSPTAHAHDAKSRTSSPAVMHDGRVASSAEARERAPGIEAVTTTAPATNAPHARGVKSVEDLSSAFAPPTRTATTTTTTDAAAVTAAAAASALDRQLDDLTRRKSWLDAVEAAGRHVFVEGDDGRPVTALKHRLVLVASPAVSPLKTRPSTVGQTPLALPHGSTPPHSPQSPQPQQSQDPQRSADEVACTRSGEPARPVPPSAVSDEVGYGTLDGYMWHLQTSPNARHATRTASATAAATTTTAAAATPAATAALTDIRRSTIGSSASARGGGGNGGRALSAGEHDDGGSLLMASAVSAVRPSLATTVTNYALPGEDRGLQLLSPPESTAALLEEPPTIELGKNAGKGEGKDEEKGEKEDRADAGVKDRFNGALEGQQAEEKNVVLKDDVQRPLSAVPPEGLTGHGSQPLVVADTGAFSSEAFGEKDGKCEAAPGLQEGEEERAEPHSVGETTAQAFDTPAAPANESTGGRKAGADTATATAHTLETSHECFPPLVLPTIQTAATTTAAAGTRRFSSDVSGVLTRQHEAGATANAEKKGVRDRAGAAGQLDTSTEGGTQVLGKSSPAKKASDTDEVTTPHTLMEEGDARPTTAFPCSRHRAAVRKDKNSSKDHNSRSIDATTTVDACARGYGLESQHQEKVSDKENDARSAVGGQRQLTPSPPPPPTSQTRHARRGSSASGVNQRRQRLLSCEAVELPEVRTTTATTTTSNTVDHPLPYNASLTQLTASGVGAAGTQEMSEMTEPSFGPTSAEPSPLLLQQVAAYQVLMENNNNSNHANATTMVDNNGNTPSSVPLRSVNHDGVDRLDAAQTRTPGPMEGLDHEPSPPGGSSSSSSRSTASNADPTTTRPPAVQAPRSALSPTTTTITTATKTNTNSTAMVETAATAAAAAPAAPIGREIKPMLMVPPMVTSTFSNHRGSNSTRTGRSATVSAGDLSAPSGLSETKFISGVLLSGEGRLEEATPPSEASRDDHVQTGEAPPSPPKISAATAPVSASAPPSLKQSAEHVPPPAVPHQLASPTLPSELTEVLQQHQQQQQQSGGVMGASGERRRSSEVSWYTASLSSPSRILTRPGAPSPAATPHRSTQLSSRPPSPSWTASQQQQQQQQRRVSALLSSQSLSSGSVRVVMVPATGSSPEEREEYVLPTALTDCVGKSGDVKRKGEADLSSAAERPQSALAHSPDKKTGTEAVGSHSATVLPRAPPVTSAATGKAVKASPPTTVLPAIPAARPFTANAAVSSVQKSPSSRINSDPSSHYHVSTINGNNHNNTAHSPDHRRPCSTGGVVDGGSTSPSPRLAGTSVLTTGQYRTWESRTSPSLRIASANSATTTRDGFRQQSPSIFAGASGMLRTPTRPGSSASSTPFASRSPVKDFSSSR